MTSLPTNLYMTDSVIALMGVYSFTKVNEIYYFSLDHVWEPHNYFYFCFVFFPFK